MPSLASIFQGLSGSASSSPVPYFANFRAAPSLSTLPDGLLEGLAGFVFAQFGRSEDGTGLILTCWASSEHFAAGRSRLEQRLPGSALRDHGRVHATAVPVKRWWRRIKPLTVVLSVAAAIGAFDAIMIRYDWLLARPNLLLKTDKLKFDVVEAADFRATASIANQLPRTEHQNIRLKVELAGKEKAPLRLAEPSIAMLGGGAAKEVLIEGKAPAPGVYRLRIQAEADAGRWRDTETFSGEADVIVWPRNPHGSVRLLESGSEWVRLGGSIDIGQAASHGLDCEMLSQGVPGLGFDRRFRAGVGTPRLQWRQAGEGKSVVSVLAWSMAAVESMRTVDFEVILQGAPSTDWKQVAQELSLNCHARQEDLK